MYDMLVDFEVYEQAKPSQGLTIYILWAYPRDVDIVNFPQLMWKDIISIDNRDTYLDKHTGRRKVKRYVKRIWSRAMCSIYKKVIPAVAWLPGPQTSFMEIDEIVQDILHQDHAPSQATQPVHPQAQAIPVFNPTLTSTTLGPAHSAAFQQQQFNWVAAGEPTT